MQNDTFYLLAAPEQLPQLRRWNAFPALFSCRLSESGTLLHLPDALPAAGGVLVLSDCSQPLRPCAPRLCPELLRTCLRQGARGLLLDFDARDEAHGAIVSTLAPLLAGRGITLFVPEYYAPAAPSARVLISSALSGGTLEQRLEEALVRFGADRTVLALEKAAEDFPLPAPDGCGTPLTDLQLRQMLERLRPAVWFSTPLCARYFTYLTAAGAVRFVLFDDDDTLRRKVETARRLGICRFLLPWAEVCGSPDSFGLRRR